MERLEAWAGLPHLQSLFLYSQRQILKVWVPESEASAVVYLLGLQILKPHSDLLNQKLRSGAWQAFQVALMHAKVLEP